MHAPIRLDVRRMPPWERHAAILAAFDGLLSGNAMIVVNDHEPRPLHEELRRSRAGRFTWAARNLGEDEWEVELCATAVVGGSTDVAAVLAQAPALRGAHARTRTQLAAVAVTRQLASGTRACHQGERWPYLGIVCEGTLAMLASAPDGREFYFFDIVPLETFGEVALLDGGDLIGSATVVSPSARIVCIPAPELLAALRTDAALACSLAAACAQRARRLAQRLAAQIASPAIARIAVALLPYAPPERGLAPALSPLPHLTHEQIAFAAGTVKEVAGRALAALEDAGAIALDRGRVARTDRESLVAFANAPSG